MSRTLFFVIIGLGGAAILVGLGIWQMQRLDWKQSLIRDIDARMKDAPVALPEMPTPQEDAFLPVAVTGVLEKDVLRVLVSQKEKGPGFRLISAMVREKEGDRILIDRGVISVDLDNIVTPERKVTIVGNLQWPRETDSFTPSYDPDADMWFARDVDLMADELITRRIMVVAREVSFDAGDVSPLPVDTSAIPNNHLQYAITWFSLAVVWLAMSVAFLRRRAPLLKG